MKTYNNLYGKVYAYENLLSAYLKCKRGKGDKQYAQDFAANLDGNLRSIQNDLIAKTWTSHGYTRFTVSDPKPRTINAPDFGDRVVHRTLYDVIGPLFEMQFGYDSYACRKGKGTHAGIRRLKRFIQSYREPIYYLKVDVKSYFASIDHTVLTQIIRRTIADRDVLDLIEKILDSYHDTPGVGIPLGNLTSQLFANVYLNELDTFVKHHLKARHYIRYMDDIVLLHPEKEQLWEWRDAIAGFLGTLKLRLHPRKQVVAPVRCGIDFLGYVVFRDHVRIRNRNIHRVYDRMKWIEEGTYPRDPMSSIMSWMGYSIHADAYHLNESIKRKHPFLAAGTEKFYGAWQ
ncbi:MAG: reverse transcriptase/maturase family protein [Clostridia bacterium]|jgi:retron-type reverse transcriptase